LKRNGAKSAYSADNRSRSFCFGERDFGERFVDFHDLNFVSEPRPAAEDIGIFLRRAASFFLERAANACQKTVRGFTSECTVRELAPLAERHGVPIPTRSRAR